MDTKGKPTKKHRVSKEEIATRQRLLQVQEKYFQSKLDRANKKVKNLLQENSDLKAHIETEKQNSVIKAEKEKAKKANSHNLKMNRLKQRVINCTQVGSSIQNIGFSKSKDKLGITGRELRITLTDGVPCKSSRHFVEPTDAKIVIETTRDNDIFCLSFCSNCLQVFLKGLKAVDEHNTYYIDNEKDIEIIYTESFVGQRCFSCYSGKGACYFIRIGNIAFRLCPDCRACWLMQLESAVRKI